MSSKQIRRVLAVATLVTAVVAAAPAQAQQTDTSARPRPGAMQGRMGGMQGGRMGAMHGGMQGGRMGAMHGGRLGGMQADSARRLERQVEFLTNELALSAEQAKQVRAILERQHAQGQALMAQAGMGPARRDSMRAGQRQRPTEEQVAARRAQMDDVRKQMEEHRAQTESELAKVLNAEQLAKFRALHPQRGPGGRGGMMQGRGGRMGGARPGAGGR